ncbi:MAG: hypothetical protein H6736_09535 [Alphaproteobacteria bacterium]|nr:hypothetical protein [Alphaproteobacteria bacterium]
MRSWTILGLLGLVACEVENEGGGRGRLRFDPPAEPAHEVSQEGFLHARGYETPFLCPQPGGGYGACPEDGVWPEARFLSCDASGCHGDFDFGLSADPAPRHLRGGDGPSCTTCHDRVWSTQTAGVGTVQ